MYCFVAIYFLAVDIEAFQIIIRPKLNFYCSRMLDMVNRSSKYDQEQILDESRNDRSAYLQCETCFGTHHHAAGRTCTDSEL